jgi:hypothetical protein
MRGPLWSRTIRGVTSSRGSACQLFFPMDLQGADRVVQRIKRTDVVISAERGSSANIKATTVDAHTEQGI